MSAVPGLDLFAADGSGAGCPGGAGRTCAVACAVGSGLAARGGRRPAPMCMDGHARRAAVQLMS